EQELRDVAAVRCELGERLSQIEPGAAPRIGADVFLVYSAANAATEDEHATARARLAANPLWRKLRAVRAGQVYEVDSFTWAGGGIIWADRVLDDLAERLWGAAPARSAARTS
ncbi:MAG: hypothetical protein K2X91_05585, partial [Thermoleophilia bacterium]|nr:hypothetical protein [Thermoleophilia bacterium]